MSISKKLVARLFRNGRSQAVRLPKEFRFEGDRVLVRKVAGGVLLEPVITDPAAWFAEMDKIKGDRLFPKGRRQPKPPRREIFR